MRPRLDIVALALCASAVVTAFALVDHRGDGVVVGDLPATAGSAGGSEVAGVTATAAPRAARLPRADATAPVVPPVAAYAEGSLRLEGSVRSDEAGAALAGRTATAFGLTDEDVSNQLRVDERSRDPLVVRVDERFGVPGDDGALQPGLEAVLDVAVTALVRLPEARLVVTGHTDDVGDEATNQQLSVARAQVVVDALIRRGVQPERLSAEGAGESTPVAGNETADGRAANRRIELRFEGVTAG